MSDSAFHIKISATYFFEVQTKRKLPIYAAQYLLLFNSYLDCCVL